MRAVPSGSAARHHTARKVAHELTGPSHRAGRRQIVSRPRFALPAARPWIWLARRWTESSVCFSSRSVVPDIYYWVTYRCGARPTGEAHVGAHRFQSGGDGGNGPGG